MVKVWLADIRPLLAEEMYQECYQRLPLWRRRKADRINSAAGRARSAGAWALREYARARMEVCEDAVYNLSHSGDYALCAISSRKGARLGCDVETVKGFREKVAERFFCQKEYAHLMSLGEGDARTDMFYRYWVLKESFMKATGRGMALDMQSFEIGWGPCENPFLLRKPPEYPQTYYYREYRKAGINVKIAICTTDPVIDEELQVTEIDVCVH